MSVQSCPDNMNRRGLSTQQTVHTERRRCDRTKLWGLFVKAQGRAKESGVLSSSFSFVGEDCIE